MQNPAAATFYNLGAVPRAPEDPLLELGIAFLLIGLNGLFALSELSIVSARKARLKTMADSGRAGAATALRLAEDPGRFLSTVQIGITLVGILAGAFSGAALGDRLTQILLDQGMPERAAEPLGYGLVIGYHHLSLRGGGRTRAQAPGAEERRKGSPVRSHPSWR